MLTATPQNFGGLWNYFIEQKWLYFASGSVAAWSKALVLGISHFDDVGSNPTAANCLIIRRLSFEPGCKMYVTLETPRIWSIHGRQSMLYTNYVCF